ncbi:MAG: hypothetical protein DPW16_09415 [Chloroflexi bacterium]|nr:hypothetical protein [Chloroflexota bacterium]
MLLRKMMVITIGMALLFVASPSTLQAQDSACAVSLNGESAQDYLASGQHYAHDLLNTPCALADFSAAIELDASLVEAYVGRARLYMETDAYDLALADLDAAYQLDPQNATVLALRGRVYAGPNAVDTLGGPFVNLYLGYTGYGDDYLSAINDLDQAVGLDPNNLDVILAYGDFYGINGDYESAISQYSVAIDLYPDDPRGYYYRAFAYLKIARAISSDRTLTPEVSDDLNRVVELAPDSRWGIYAQGFLLDMHGDFPAAIDEYERGTLLYPNDAAMHYRMAYAITVMIFGRPLERGSNERGLAAMARAVELAPFSTLYWVRQGFIVVTLDIDFTLALTDHHHALEISPDFPPALLNLAGLHTFSQQYRDCEQSAAYLDDVLFIYGSERVRAVQEFKDFEATYAQRCIETAGPEMVDVGSPLYPAGTIYTLGIRPLMLENVPGNPSSMVVCSPGTESTVARTAQNPDDGLTYVYLQCDGGEGWILETLLQ